MADWRDSVIYGTCIVGARYLTFVSFYYPIQTVLERILEYVEDNGWSKEPFVLLSTQYLSNSDGLFLVERELAQLVLE